MYGCLPRSRYDEIVEAVIDMLEECEVIRYPIDPFSLIRKLRYILRPYSSLDAEALRKAIKESKDAYSQLEEDQKTGMIRFVIYYNDALLNKGRIRWTLLHEIGHCFLGHHSLKVFKQKKIEEEANYFAKYAIAPPPLVMAMDIHSAAELEETFITSKEAAEYSFEYYTKWRSYKQHHPEPSECEMRLLEMVYRVPA